MLGFKTKEEIERDAIQEIRNKWNKDREISIPLIEKPEKPAEIMVPKESFFKRIFIHKKEEPINTEQFEIQKLKESAKEQINKIVEGTNYDSLIDLNRIFRIFLRERWQISRTLTYEELVWGNRLQSVPESCKDKILQIVIEINDFLYGKKEIAPEYLKEIANKILEVIEES